MEYSGILSSAKIFQATLTAFYVLLLKMMSKAVNGNTVRHDLLTFLVLKRHEKLLKFASVI